MRSRPYKRELSELIRLQAMEHLYACKCRSRRIARFDDIAGGHRVLTGIESCARHRCGRAMRLWWRMKRFARASLPTTTEEKQ